MPELPWLVALLAVALLAVGLYWLLVLTEGTYLGPRVVTGLYNRVARRYDSIKQFDDEDEAYFLGRPVARFLAGCQDLPDAPPWLLDVAAGTGRLPLAVLPASQGGCRVVVLDRAEAMLHEARRKLAALGRDQVVYLAQDAARLPFADGQFCVVACLEALEFMPQPVAVMAEALRVVQPGGLLVLTNRIGREARLLPGKTFTRDRLAETLRSMGAAGVEIMSWQMDYDLVFAVKQGQRPLAVAAAWIELLQCPCCAGKPLVAAGAGPEMLACSQCGWRLVPVDGLWRSASG